MANNSRDDFSESTKRLLKDRVGSLCSNPACRTLTTGPNENQQKIINIGVGAHITAASEGGPRYNRNLTSEQRQNYLNGIWLCQCCAKLIDDDESFYTITLLNEWKSQAEEYAREVLKGDKSKIKSTDESKDVLGCPQCGTEVKNGLFVCKGCNSDIVYGPTIEERLDARRTGGFIFGSIVFFLVVILPEQLSHYFNFPKWHFSVYTSILFVFIPIIIAVLIGAFYGDRITIKRKKELIRFFRRTFVKVD